MTSGTDFIATLLRIIIFVVSIKSSLLPRVHVLNFTLNNYLKSVNFQRQRVACQRGVRRVEKEAQSFTRWKSWADQSAARQVGGRLMQTRLSLNTPLLLLSIH